MAYDLETGDRSAFLGRLRRRLGTGVPGSALRPIDRLEGSPPEPGFASLDRDDLVDSFRCAATAVDAVVHVVTSDLDLQDVAAEIVRRHRPGAFLHGGGMEADPLARLLYLECGIPQVLEHDRRAPVPADLSLTVAEWGIAATGSVVHASGSSSSRAMVTLPQVHVCVLSEDRILATPSDLYRRALRDAPLPSGLVVITGPSRTGDIEQILTLGVHGPVALHVVITTESAEEPRWRSSAS